MKVRLAAMKPMPDSLRRLAADDPGIGALVLIGIFVCVVVLVIVWRTTAARGHGRSRAALLLRDTLGGLGFAARDRQLLRRIARELALEHPVSLVLSPALFARHTGRWLADQPAPARQQYEPRLRRFAGALFPETAATTGVESDR